jgi:quinol monooxygenase YgiN
VGKQVLILTIPTKPGRRDDVRAAWDRHLRARVEASEAQELYLFCEDVDDPDVVRIVEVYNDLGAMAENARAPWFAAYIQETREYVDGHPSMARAEPVWAKGLTV